ncbi:UrvD/REP family ATP-dependent DNA helicase [Klugiella xanthotipulae]|nr:UrvD/REP family ATP-dependent DNA helicase [Klugiella xanthotipulae]
MSEKPVEMSFGGESVDIASAPTIDLGFDHSQHVALAVPVAAHAVIVGAPGSGKTTVLMRMYRDRILRDGLRAEEIMVLSPTRLSATRLRDDLDALMPTPSAGPRARTSTSLAVQIVSTARALRGRPLPRLLTGPSQDHLIARLLDDGVAAQQHDPTAGISWPVELGEDVRSLQGFRNQLRELIRVCTDYGISPEELRALSRAHDRSVWAACADFLPLYRAAAAREFPDERDLSQFHREAIELLTAVSNGNEQELLLGDIARLRVILVDDAHELTRSSIELLAACARRGVSIVLCGDPDITTGTFQGAEATVLGALENVVGQPVRRIVLNAVYRHGPRVRGFVQRITGAIGAAGWGTQRAAASTLGDVSGGEQGVSSPTSRDTVLFSRVESAAEQNSVIARYLRERNLRAPDGDPSGEGLPWSRMAIICRTRGQADSIAEALVSLDVPTAVAAGGTVLRDHSIVRDLVWVAAVAVGMEDIDAPSLNRVLRGPLGGLDHIALRRLRSSLLHEEREAGGNQNADALLLTAFTEPAGFLTLDIPQARAADRLRQIIRDARTAVTGSIEDILWAAWDRSGLSDRWERQALHSTGVLAEDANRSLDAVVALFFSAQRFEERSPGSDPREFIYSLRNSDVPEDTLAPQGTKDTVTVTTPNGVIGRDFDLVVIPGVQEGVWPNLRIRGSLLGTEHLAALSERGQVTGTPRAAQISDGAEPSHALDERRLVLHDELRMFAQAVSRSTGEVIVLSVADEDSVPSRFYDLAPEGSEASLPSGQLSLRGLVGQLRSDLETGLVSASDEEGHPENERTRGSAQALALLAREGVAGAAPHEWYGIEPPTTDRPLVDLSADNAAVRVSPSRMESFEACELDWIIGTLGGGNTNNAAGLGTLVHRALEEEPVPHVATLMAHVDEGWPALTFDAAWDERRMHEKAHQMVIRLAEYLYSFERAKGALVSAEQNFRVRLGPVDLRGAIDRVESYPLDDAAEARRIVIVDLKTGNPDVTKNTVDANAQLTAYQLALAEGAIADVPPLAVSGGAKLVVVSPDRARTYVEIAQQTFAAEKMDEFRARLREAATGMAGASFRASIASHCSNPHSHGLCVIHTVRPVSYR